MVHHLIRRLDGVGEQTVSPCNDLLLDKMPVETRPAKQLWHSCSRRLRPEDHVCSLTETMGIYTLLFALRSSTSAGAKLMIESGRCQSELLRRPILYPLTLFCFFLLGCNGVHDQSDRLTAYGSDFVAAENRAAFHSAEDEIKNIASDVRRIPLTASPLQYVAHVALDAVGNIVVLDSARNAAYAFDNKGRYLGPIGESGRGPGHYQHPMAICQTRDGVAIADFADHRVNLFRSDKSLRGSFTYSSQSFSATGISYNASTDTYYLFGNRPTVIDGATSTELVNMYSGDGTFMQSTFAFPQEWLRFNLMPIDLAVVAKDEKETTSFALPFAAVLHTISSQSQKVEDKLVDLPSFRPPHTPLPRNFEELNNIHTWELEYTPIRALFLHGDRAYVEYETDQKLRYSIAVINLSSGKTTRLIQTNYLIKSGNAVGQVVFLNNPGIRSEGHRELYSGKFP